MKCSPGHFSTEALECFPECSAAELAFPFIERYKNMRNNMRNGSDDVLLCYFSDCK